MSNSLHTLVQSLECSPPGLAVNNSMSAMATDGILFRYIRLSTKLMILSVAIAVLYGYLPGRTALSLGRYSVLLPSEGRRVCWPDGWLDAIPTNGHPSQHQPGSTYRLTSLIRPRGATARSSDYVCYRRIVHTRIM